MCRRVNPDQFHKPDLRWFGKNGHETRTAEDYLERLREWIDDIPLSPFLHPDTEEYINRVFNTFMYGYYHYPLFTVADTLSYLALELSLKRRFKYQYGRDKRTLSILLNRAISEGVLNFKDTKKVRAAYERYKEWDAFGILDTEERSIGDIAAPAAEKAKRLIPLIRGDYVHPESTSLIMPGQAIAGIRQIIDWINILTEKSEVDFRNLSHKIGFDWLNVDFISGDGTEPYLDYTLRFGCNDSNLYSDLTSFISLIAQHLGIKPSNTDNQLWILNSFGILPSRPYEALLQFIDGLGKKRPETIDDKELVKGIHWIESRCTDLLEEFRTKYVLRSPEATLSFELDVSPTGRRTWQIVGEGNGIEESCQLDNRELSYYLLMRLGIWGADCNRLDYELRVLRKIIGGVDTEWK